MIRARFYIKFKDCGNDYRPVKWPIKYPYWCTGGSVDSFVIVAYAENVEQINDLWPEAYMIECEEVNENNLHYKISKTEVVQLISM